MSRMIGIAVGAALLAIPGLAAAQSGGVNPHGSTYSSSNGAAVTMRNQGLRFDRWGDVNREDMERDLDLRNENQERLALADRVAALVDEGRCRAAEDLANAERDRTMARNVRRICEEGVGLKARYRE